MGLGACPGRGWAVPARRVPGTAPGARAAPETLTRGRCGLVPAQGGPASGSGEGPAGDFAAYFAAYNAEFDRARAGLSVAALGRLLAWLEETRLAGRQLFVLGNGGSAASASHWACDFGKGVRAGGHPGLRVLCPAEQTSWLTALSNDISYADALAEHLGNWVLPLDLIVALSVSGDSENLVRAFHLGRRRGARLVAVVGQAGGRLRQQADLAVVIPSRDYGVVEDLHMTVNHTLSQFIRRRLQGDGG